jgi:putative ABC transport system permease protein
MFINYFKSTWRNLIRNKAFSFINILGLALGMAGSILIFLWVNDERAVNAFHTKKADLYRVYERVFSEGKVEAGPATPGLLARELKRQLPEIKYATGYWEDENETLFSVGEKNFSRMGTYADSDFFKMFSYPLLEGTTTAALSEIDNIAISRSMAESIFGSTHAALGKALLFNNAVNFKVAAVFEDLPANTSQHFEFVLNWKYLVKVEDWFGNWINRAPSTYIELQPGTDPAKVEAQIKNFVIPYLNADRGGGFHPELGMQRFDEIYLNSVFKNGKPDGGRIEYVRLFSLVAVFILLIACINFMNLATARSAKRAKEVGVRKTVGALRIRLIIQFIGEAILLTFLAALIAFVLVILVLPYFNLLTGKQMALPLELRSFWFSIIGLLLITGFVAGSYPALFLSSLNPVSVLKGALKFSPKALLFRKSLVVFQFVLSILLIIGTIVISTQIKYLQTKNLGFDRENLIYIHFPYPEGLAGGYQVFKQELLIAPGIKSVDFSAQPPSHTVDMIYDLNWEGKNPNSKEVAISNWVGYDYFKLMNIQLSQGRVFSRDFPSDSSGIIINETALKMIGFKNPIGRQIILSGGQRKTIVGVVKDFHFKSLQEAIEPLLLFLAPKNPDWGYLFIKTEPGETQKALANIGKLYKQMEPKFPLDYFFASEEYQKLYNSELTIGKLSDCFSFLAIFISCLGLLGLTMFTAEQRRKEIGVRKVIGASKSDIVIMLSKDIIKLVVLSSVIATPIAWLAMNYWLQHYAYRISISWWVFFTATLSALLIALLTISYQAIKAAVANPVMSLRTE